VFHFILHRFYKKQKMSTSASTSTCAASSTSTPIQASKWDWADAITPARVLIFLGLFVLVLASIVMPWYQHRRAWFQFQSELYGSFSALTFHDEALMHACVCPWERSSTKDCADFKACLQGGFEHGVSIGHAILQCMRAFIWHT
jgi:hypothetical protein